MKLQQLRYLAAVAQTGLNITAAAERLHTSQPGMSKQIKLIEDELGFQIFVRDARALSRVTLAGQQVLDRAVRILREVQNIKHLSDDLKNESHGSLSLATTHTQARYVLPRIIKQFRDNHTDVRLHLHQGTSEQIGEMAALDRVDFAIATGAQSLFEGFTLLPCYRWHRHVVVPRNHPLANVKRPTLKQLVAYPIVTYVFSVSGPSSLNELFAKEGLAPNVVLTAQDSDVIKTYVRLGLGIGIVASMAVEAHDDADLVNIDASDLFPAHTTWIGFRRGGLLRKYQIDFIQLFAPHLTRRLIERAVNASSKAEVDELTAGLELPLR